MIRAVFLIIGLLLAGSGSVSAGDQSGGIDKKTSKGKATHSRKVKTKFADTTPRISIDDRLQQLKREWRLGNIDDKTMWLQISSLTAKLDDYNSRDRSQLLQTNAQLLFDGGYPIIASILAAQAITAAEDPEDKDLVASWTLLSQVSQNKPIGNLLEVLARNVSVKGAAPVFGNDWYYFKANVDDTDGHTKKALIDYAQMKIDDRYFLAAKYQEAMIAVQEERPQDAEKALRVILYGPAFQKSTLPAKTKALLVDYAHLALGRLYYQQRQFTESVRSYRLVRREGPLFYDALFEQAWAFFMAGYPNHALGALHGADSPFFADRFNPETAILRPIIYYWICRYDESRTALAEFMEKHADGVASLTSLLDRQHFDDETAYQLFENLISGVSSESLGVPHKILRTAAAKDSMQLVRDQYAAVVEEEQRLRARGIHQTTEGLAKTFDYLDRWGAALRKDIGNRYLKELRAMKQDYEQLYSQAQFLYVELLMSEKEQLLGKELHASSKLNHVTMKNNVAGWGKANQSWGGDDKNEFWWDEVGFYIYNVRPMCSMSPAR